MKRVFSISAVAAVLLLTFSLSASSKTKTITWTGWISDSGCGAKGMSADHKNCAITCVKEKGAKYVFVNSESKEVFAIHNQDAVGEENIGMEVKLTGHVMGDRSLHVDKIEPAS